MRIGIRLDAKLGGAIAIFLWGAGASAVSFPSGSLEDWIQLQAERSCARLLSNVNENGSVIASRSVVNPDYHFHWVRDAAKVMHVVHELYLRNDPALRVSRDFYLNRLRRYVEFSHENQLSHTLSGNGEPKFYLNGKPYEGPWIRPQADGPANRAMTLIPVYHSLRELGDSAESLGALLRVIHHDLDDIAQSWRNLTGDLWEEAIGNHFYTRLLQKYALAQGLRLEQELGDDARATSYQQEALSIERELHHHWSEQNQTFLGNAFVISGKMNKPRGFDTSVVLAVNRVKNLDDWLFSFADDRVLASVQTGIEVFQELYEINRDPEIPGLSIGRYGNDTFNGVRTDAEGNPWFLATQGFGEFHFNLIQALNRRGRIEVTPRSVEFYRSVVGAELSEAIRPGAIFLKTDPLFRAILESLFRRGEGFLRRIQYHAGSEGNLSEQFDRRSGLMTGVDNLTWSHASQLTASWAREEASKILRSFVQAEAKSPGPDEYVGVK